MNNILLLGSKISLLTTRSTFVRSSLLKVFDRSKSCKTLSVPLQLVDEGIKCRFFVRGFSVKSPIESEDVLVSE